MRAVSWMVGSAEKSRDREKPHDPFSKNSEAATPVNHHSMQGKESSSTGIFNQNQVDETRMSTTYFCERSIRCFT